MAKKKQDPGDLLMTPTQKHFGEIPLKELVTAYRQFPVTARVDLQRVLEKLFSEQYSQAKLFGIHRHFDYSAINFSSLLDVERNPVLVGPLQYDEVDIGEELPARCLKYGLWLARFEEMPIAVLLALPERHSDEGISLGVAVPPGQAGFELSHKFLENLEQLVYRTGSFRGKVISLEAGSRYSGKTGAVRVHKLHSVARQEVILPERTLELLDRNVAEFIQCRAKLRELGMAVKKGLLFYGPPGTGKTHTIHYLANQLPDHTTLLITAGQVGLLDEYFLLARFLQPAMVVIEDADLIARDRETMHGPCEESLLNKLLNEMDGLREDAEILFVLTTNRPEHLEAALASRPGRIDQAIEFPLPDKEGRKKLILLYSRGLQLSDDLVDYIAERTDKASAAFIKELMRRAAQHYLQRSEGLGLQEDHVRLALEDMLFSGGTLNLKLLGGALKE